MTKVNKIELQKSSFLLTTVACISLFILIIFFSYAIYGGSKATYSASTTGTCYSCDSKTWTWVEGAPRSPDCGSSDPIIIENVTKNDCDSGRVCPSGYVYVNGAGECYKLSEGTKYDVTFVPNDNGRTSTITKTCYQWNNWNKVACYIDEATGYSKMLSAPKLNAWTGWTFKGWTEAEKSKIILTPNTSFIPSKDKTYFVGVWVNDSTGYCSGGTGTNYVWDDTKQECVLKTVDPTPIQYTVYLNLNGGTAANTKETRIPVPYYNSIKLDEIYDWYTGDITKSGYTLNGWCYDKDCSGTIIYSMVDSKEDGKDLYANWKSDTTVSNSYTVYLDLNGGTWSNCSNCNSSNYVEKIEYYGQKTFSDIYLQYGNPIRNNYTFEGWCYDKNCSGKIIHEYVDSDENGKTLYAKWVDSTKPSNSDPEPSSSEEPSSSPSSTIIIKPSSTASSSSQVVINPQTGSTLVIVAWVVGIVALIISIYYFRKNYFVSK